MAASPPIEMSVNCHAGKAPGLRAWLDHPPQPSRPASRPHQAVVTASTTNQFRLLRHGGFQYSFDTTEEVDNAGDPQTVKDLLTSLAICDNAGVFHQPEVP